MLILLGAVFAHQTYVQTYNPHGPLIVATMSSGKSFTIATDPQTSPKTAAHVIDLVRRGFYDGQRVHRVESWVTQWGAPASKDQPLDIPTKQKDGSTKLELNPKVGDGGSGKDLSAFEEAPKVDFTRGIVGVASDGLQRPGDSQLFILKKDTLRLFRSYAVVGKVVAGMDVVDGIKRGDRIRSMKVVLVQSRSSGFRVRRSGRVRTAVAGAG